MLWRKQRRQKYQEVCKLMKRCPRCSSTDIAKIVWGLPNMESFKKEDKDKYVFGGCCVSDDDPEYSCNNCGEEF